MKMRPGRDRVSDGRKSILEGGASRRIHLSSMLSILEVHSVLLRTSMAPVKRLMVCVEDVCSRCETMSSISSSIDAQEPKDSSPVLLVMSRARQKQFADRNTSESHQSSPYGIVFSSCVCFYHCKGRRRDCRSTSHSSRP